MKKIPTAEEYFKPFRNENATYGVREIENHLRQFAALHVEAALKAAAKNAEAYTEGAEGNDAFVDKDSILSAYPKELIQ